ncbi:branched-chain amino acid aminotransferase [Exophiala aquamarina CBS 119918]|uniref:Branched-chain-amino-acid aminotransferase n=1 Tax=Exophiala aquamarina CBS 119918 TaxID=1182545 RepID=A0A072NVV7_9EURO|nr:branched-chain amino acid aminotransferase [Exophiala aquamarina CBS 119918]KEF51163.1 branched-chain amino acid aminotransferase [Exophiala aquamarina CBS 119918]
MAPAAITPISPPSPTLDSTLKLTKAGTHTTLSQTISNDSPAVHDLDASKLTITPNLNPKPVPALDSPEVWAQNVTTDHMLTARWTEKAGWDSPEIKPYGPLSIMPTASVLHYATECFEGMKAYRGFDGKVRLFRPERNAKRFLQSATRIALPGFPPEEFLKLLKKFVGVEAKKWIAEPGRYIYIRPTMIATAAALGVQKPKEALMYIMMVVFPPLDEPTPSDKGPSSAAQLSTNGGQTITAKDRASLGMRLLASRHDMIRAWPGGFGNAKVGANYGPSLVAQGEARERGYSQILWLFGDECFVTEAGGSNFFVLWVNKESGQRELVTAPLGDGVILEGVTRASVLDLVKKSRPEVDVVERRFTMNELLEADAEGRLLEAFAAGTAFFIAPIADIHFRGVDLVLPLGKAQGRGEFAMGVKQDLKDIMYGNVAHEWGNVVGEMGM